MKGPWSLSTRTLLLSFLCMCAALAAVFFALSTVVKLEVKEELKNNLEQTRQQLAETRAVYERGNTQLLAILSDNASLKAAVSLSREQAGSAFASQARETLEDQLREISRRLDFDLFMVLAPNGEVLAALGTPGDAQVDRGLRGASGKPALVRVGDRLYAVTAVPINLGGENLGTLAVGKTFDLRAAAPFTFSALLQDGKVIESNLPRSLAGTFERELAQNCGAHTDGCEIHAGDESYLVLRAGQSEVGPGYELLCVASLDDAMRGFMLGLERALIATALGSILMALLLSILASRSISRPLADLAIRIGSSRETGALWSEFRVDSSTREVNVLADALNRAAKARREFEDELCRARDAAEAGSRAKSEFMANISHELRTPMNGILGMTELALDTKLSAEQREYLELVRSSGEGLLRVVNDLLDFSQLEQRQIELETAHFNLREYLGEILSPLERRARGQRLNLSTSVDPSAPEALIGDPLGLRKVLEHLVGNAIKFTTNGGIALAVAAQEMEAEEAVLHFSVEDTGIGIAKDKQACIFEAFAQADGSATRHYGGTGLGLTIASRLVRLMRGRIWVESEDGHGSRFHFTARFRIAPQDSAPDNHRQPLDLEVHAV